MLRRLFIRNYALIDHLDVNFEQGLNIITGETGAGKSILLGALSLILGNRADTGALLDKSKKCIIEGEFEVEKKVVKSFFKEHELDFEKSTIIRREISSEGKSRAFINDTPVNLNQLKELSLLLVDIHSQHETLLLNTTQFQLDVVDAFAQHDDLLASYQQDFTSYQQLKKQLEQLHEDEKRSNADQDYFKFQFTELDEANLISDEQQKMEEELQTLTHAEEIKSDLALVLASVSGKEDNLVNQLSQLSSSLASLAKYNGRLNEAATRIKSLNIELKDITSEIESIEEEIIYDPARIEIINERLNIIYQLEQKHRLKTIDELLALKNDIESKLYNISSLEDQIMKLSKELEELKSKLIKQAKKISAGRNNAIPKIESEIKKLLNEVSLPDAVLKVENPARAGLDESRTYGIHATGIDQVKFLFSANKGVAYQDITKVASGGELSRLMLVIKSSVAKLIALPTIIFDEIDTGVSGEVALNVGKVMKRMSKHHQLIAITHLPQIASRGEAHYFVYKEIQNKRAVTKMRRLEGDDRVIEIAKMLSGEKPSSVAVENAKELLKM